jgi:micrococcal nuclease
MLTPNRRQVRVRLAEIDTPESQQPWGTPARQALSALAFRKQAIIEIQNIGRYRRTVEGGHRSLDVDAEMVRQGHAWVYRRYLRDRSLLAVEDEARRSHRGLWSLLEAEQVPPWVWRRQRAARH